MDSGDLIKALKMLHSLGASLPNMNVQPSTNVTRTDGEGGVPLKNDLQKENEERPTQKTTLTGHFK